MNAIIFYLLSLLSIAKGLYHLLVYENGDYSWNRVNAFVGGDAYNYIINSNHATAWFVLALVFAVIAGTSTISSKLDKLRVSSPGDADAATDDSTDESVEDDELEGQKEGDELGDQEEEDALDEADELSEL